MKFIVKNAGFTDAILPVAEAATKAVDKLFEDAGKITLSCAEDGITASAFGGRVAMTTLISEVTADDLLYKHEQDGEVTIAANILMDYLSSFSRKKKLVFEVKKKKDAKIQKLFISQEDNSNVYQALPCFDKAVAMPKAASAFDKSLTIPKDVFLEGIEKVFFAVGFEADRTRYLYWVLRSLTDRIRFAAGTGARFACYDIFGKDVAVNSAEKTSFLFHKEHTTVVTRIVSLTKGDKVTLKTSDPTKKDAPFQMVVGCGSSEITLVGMNPDVGWPDEDKLFNADNKYKLVTKLSDWPETAKGVSATFGDQQKKERRAHIVRLTVEPTVMTVACDDLLEANREIPVVDYSIDDNIDAGDESWQDDEVPELRCLSPHLSEIAENGYANENMQMEFIAKNKPVLVRFHAGEQVTDTKPIKSDPATGRVNSFTILFAAINQ